MASNVGQQHFVIHCSNPHQSRIIRKELKRAILEAYKREDEKYDVVHQLPRSICVYSTHERLTPGIEQLTPSGHIVDKDGFADQLYNCLPVPEEGTRLWRLDEVIKTASADLKSLERGGTVVIIAQSNEVVAQQLLTSARQYPNLTFKFRQLGRDGAVRAALSKRLALEEEHSIRILLDQLPFERDMILRTLDPKGDYCIRQAVKRYAAQWTTGAKGQAPHQEEMRIMYEWLKKVHLQSPLTVVLEDVTLSRISTKIREELDSHFPQMTIQAQTLYDIALYNHRAICQNSKIPPNIIHRLQSEDSVLQRPSFHIATR